MAETTTPATHGNPSIRWIIYIAVGVLIALVAYTGGSSLWENHQATGAREKAQKEENARQAQANHQQTQTAQKTVSRADLNRLGVLQVEINSSHPYLEERQSTVDRCYSGASGASGCDDMANALTKNRQTLEAKTIEYNNKAKTIDPTVLKSNKLPASYDKNGYPFDENGLPFKT
jgi:hypothetical protein